MEKNCEGILSSIVTDDVIQGSKVLNSGGLVAFPTETVYGLGADAANPEAVSRIFKAKGRPADHPLIVHISQVKDIDLWAVDVPKEAWRLAERFWPGPFTLILKRHSSVHNLITGGQDTVGLRVPAHPMALDLLQQFGRGIAAPSANRFGRVSPTEAAHVVEDLGGEIDLILDGGPCDIGVESTIMDFTSSKPVVLRPGWITKEALEEVLDSSISLRQGGAVRCPGQDLAHYSPRARVIVATSVEDLRAKVDEHFSSGARVAVMSSDLLENLPQEVMRVPFPKKLPEMARELYRSFRLADRLRADVVIAVCPATSGWGLTIADRLQRAAQGGLPLH